MASICASKVKRKSNDAVCFSFIRINQSTANVGKPCKTGRPANNGSSSNIGNPNITSSSTTLLNSNGNTNQTHPVVLTPTSAPTSHNAPSPHSSPSTPPAENPVILPHPSSALSAQYHSMTVKSSSSPASLRLRREMTQPVLNRIELFSSTDCPMEKMASNDAVAIPYRTSLKINGSQPPIEIRPKLLKSTSTRLSAEYLPGRQVSRSKIVTDRLPSPKGKGETTDSRGTKAERKGFFFLLVTLS